MSEKSRVTAVPTESPFPIMMTAPAVDPELRPVDARKSGATAVAAATNNSRSTADRIDVKPEIFGFEVEFESTGDIAVFEDLAVIRARFRHLNSRPIEFTPGVDGAYNLGIKLYRQGGFNLLFEDRMVIGERPIEPEKWTSASITVPKGIINFTDQFLLVADVLKEKEYWFSTCGGQEFRAEVRFFDATSKAVPREQSLGAAASRMAAAVQSPARASSSDVVTADPQTKAKVNLVFDVSDLVQYFHNARLPTGIQRVQIEVITNLIFSIPDDCSLTIGCFTKQTDTWIEVPLLFFNHICKLAVVNGDPEAPDWLRVLEELRMHLSQSKRLVFAPGAYLINLGTSWWLQNYFLHVRAAKARYGIHYVPYVHDCIPIMTPEHCVEGLTRDFITWALGAFQHADHIIVNSKATAKDVKWVAKRLGHSVREPSVVTLDADYRAANESLPPELGAVTNSELFQKNDLRSGEYVLFVSTIESRKNHLLAFSAWLALLKRHGVKKVPKLVCVGNRGWLNDAIYAKLGASALLKQKVVMLSRISDPELELLYRNCLFTLYPSSYEGWGLPVTESLCFGKVPVLANGSSLPEAGGEFGEYFELGSEIGLLVILERMMFDEPYRKMKEREITTRFRPRAWGDIAANILSLVRGWAKTDRPTNMGKEAFTARGLWPYAAQLGRYYGLIENEHTHIWPGMVSGEMFRQGDGWWWTEPWGCWTKPKGAQLAFVADLPKDSSALVYMGIRGVQSTPCTATVSLEGVTRRVVNLTPGQSQWLVFRVSREVLRTFASSAAGTLFEFLFTADRYSDFREATGGVDHRVASIGVLGFMVCAGNDVESRLRFMESVALSDLRGLMEIPESDFSDTTPPI